MKFLSAFFSLLFVTLSAQAKLSVVSKGVEKGIRNSEVFWVDGMTNKTKKTEVVEAVTRKIRHAYHRQGIELSPSTFTKIHLAKAIQTLQESTSEQKGLSEKEVAHLEEWIEDKMIDSVVVMSLAIEQNGGTGMVKHYLFLSDDFKSQPVLSISVLTYAE